VHPTWLHPAAAAVKVGKQGRVGVGLFNSSRYWDENLGQVYTCQPPALYFISYLTLNFFRVSQTFCTFPPRNSVAIHAGWARDRYLRFLHIMSSPRRAGSVSTVRTYAGLNGRPLGLLISTIATTGFLLFGYDQGVMSGIISANPFNVYFPSTKNNSVYQGFVTAIYEIGRLIGAIFILTFGDRTGRRRAVCYPLV
jgi:hypothetical protein